MISCLVSGNLILAAFPSSMKLPDPFPHSLKVDTLPEMKAENLICERLGTLGRSFLVSICFNGAGISGVFFFWLELEPKMVVFMRQWGHKIEDLFLGEMSWG
jgi:hypothetical protein